MRALPKISGATVSECASPVEVSERCATALVTLAPKRSFPSTSEPSKAALKPKFSIDETLLAPQLDAVFDAGLVTFQDDGRVLASAALPSDARILLGIVPGLKVSALSDGHRAYLRWHRSYEFIAADPGELVRAKP